MSGTEVVVALVLAIGVVGVVVPLLPGSALVVAGVLVWAASLGTGRAWAVFAVATTLVALGSVVKYAVPGRRLRRGGIPTSTLVVGAAVGVVGFFVVPVVGLVLGFVLGVFLAELRRLRNRAAAWRATVQAVRAVGLGVLVELAAALAACGVWVVGLVVT